MRLLLRVTSSPARARWPTGLYLIIKGEAQVVIEGPNGRLPVATLRMVPFLARWGMLTGEARSATVIAVTAVDCYRLDKEGFAKVLQQRPEIATEMSAIVEARNTERGGVRLAAAGQSMANHGDLLGRIRNFFSLRN
jgi:CRP-like cAMP-binding protein